MARKILIIVAVLLLLLVGIIMSRPSTFTVSRSKTIAAPPAIVFAQVSDFHKWADWSPWEKLDPNMQKTYGGPESGTGATYEWSGSGDVGKGKMTITSAANDNVEIDLEFIEPFPAKNKTVISLKPAGEGTDVTWSMSGENNFLGKAMSLVMDMDRMIGTDFDKGLESLSMVSMSAAAAAPAPAPEPEPAEAPAVDADGGTAAPEATDAAPAEAAPEPAK